MHGRTATVERRGAGGSTEAGPLLPGQIARAPRLTSRAVRSEVFVLPREGDPITLAGLEALVWRALTAPCDLHELTARVAELVRTPCPDEVAGAVRALVGQDLLCTSAV